MDPNCLNGLLRLQVSPQGCILSPILFALYIDAISDILPGGISFAGNHIKVLLYADDLVMLADNPFALQLQINRLQSFCETWDLKINVMKTKVMIFENRKRARLREENWRLNNDRIEVVHEFKYLGVLISYNLNFNTHAREKSREAKLALNIMWPKFFANQSIDPASKYCLFNATVNTCMCYGVQAFGVSPFEEFESVQRFFFKRLFRLPNVTPTYAIHVESGLPPIYLQNLKAHSDYLTKVMKRSESSLHRLILIRLLQTNASPFRDWNQLALSHDLSISFSESNVSEWQNNFAMIIEKVDDKIFDQHLTRASSSASRFFYRNLNHQMFSQESYFKTEFTSEIISTIFRARVELLKLNFSPHRADLPQTCNLCNRREPENTYHFIAVCPILQEIRRLYFQESFLSLDSFYEILNGARGWLVLFKFCNHALIFRNSFR